MMTITEAVAGLVTGSAARETREGEAIRVVLEALRDPAATITLANAVRAELGTMPASQALLASDDPKIKPTDSQMLDWLIARGYTPANWRPATWRELRANLHHPNGMILLGSAGRSKIAQAMKKEMAKDTSTKKAT